MRKYFLYIFIILAASACSNKFYIEQHPIQFGPKRKALTLEYMKQHYGIVKDEPTITPKMVVVHWTANDSYEGTIKYFDSPTLNNRPAIQSASNLNVSSQYVIGRDGQIAQLLPDTVMARHVIGLNWCAIGIENVGSGRHPLTDAQLRANAWLIRKLTKKYDIEYLIGHQEYQLFEGTPLWKEKDDNYRTGKIDPGEFFMLRLRQKLKDLNLKGPLDLKKFQQMESENSL